MISEASCPRVRRSRPRVCRVVTAPEAVQFHLQNTLRYLPADFELTVVGDGVSIYRERYPGVRWVDVAIPRQIELIRDFVSLVRLIVFLRYDRPDILHSIMPKAGLLTAIAGWVVRVPVRMHTFTGQTWVEKSGLARAFLKRLDWLIVKLNTVCYTDSPSQSVYLARQGVTLHGTPLPVLGDGSLGGVDMTRFDPSRLAPDRAEFRQGLGIAPEETVFIFVGRKCRDKGIFECIRAFDALIAQGCHAARLLLVGPDESRGELEATLTARTAGHIFNIGRVDQPERYMAAADVLCIPSYREGFGTVVIEAAALGLPAIGTRIFGLSDSIEDGRTGLLVEPRSVEQLANAMQRLANDSHLRSAMSSQARDRTAGQFSDDRMYALLRESYFQALSKDMVK